MTVGALRIGIVGAGPAARALSMRLRALDGVTAVGVTDVDASAARALASTLSTARDPVEAYADHAELIRRANPTALAIFTDHAAGYRPAIDALQAGCHLFLQRPMANSVQEASDIAGLAKARGLLVGIGHHLRLLPSLIRTRARVSQGAIGPLRLVTATLTLPWLDAFRSSELDGRFDPKLVEGGILADAGRHLIDALLWTSGRSAVAVSAIQAGPGLGADVVTAAAIQLDDGTPATLGLSGVSPRSRFELTFHGERGRIQATETSLVEEIGEGPELAVPLTEAPARIEADFVAALRGDGPLCCPAEEALATVRLQEAMARSAAIGQLVRLA
jgi:predicted dehydrogenase